MVRRILPLDFSGEREFMVKALALGAVAVLGASLCFRGVDGQESSDRFEQLLQQAQSADANKRVDAWLQLSSFPDQAERLLVPLVEAMIGNDTRVGEAAQRTAEQLSEPLLAYADSQLEADSQKQVAAAAEMIYRLGNQGIASTPKLVQLTKSEDPKRRLSGLWGLVYLKNTDPTVVQAIAPFLDDPDFRNRVVACRAIATIGPPAVELAGKLKSLVETGNISTRSHAMIALGSIGPNPEFDVVELLGNHLDVFLQPERDRALVGLMHLGPAAISLKDTVEQLMNNPDKSVQPQAALTLWKMTGDPLPSVKALAEMTKSPDLQYEALNALYQMQGDAVTAVDEIAAQLQNEDSAVRAVSVEILENLGDAAAHHREKLARLAQEDDDPLVRFYCARTLGKLSEGSQ